jgi:starch synthase
MVSSEIEPLASSGGLGASVRSLALALKAAGHDLRVAVPRYASLGGGAEESAAEKMRVPFLDGEEEAILTRTTLPGSRIPVYCIGHQALFGREGIYGGGAEADYPDNPERFALFCRGAFQACRGSGWIPEIMHLHDWPSALCAVFLRHAEAYGEFRRTASVLTIHNAMYQGIYAKDSFPAFRLPWDLFHQAGFEDYDRINLLKAGIACADAISTVSPSYAREIQTPEFGFRLDGLLRHRARDFTGILNGIDASEWDPAGDGLIAAAFSPRDLSGKAACKAALQREFGLPEDERVPLIAFSARLNAQKGIHELFAPGASAARPICSDMAVQFVAAGSGEPWCEEELRALSAQLPNFRARVGHSPQGAHRIMAGADFFLMPNRFEPCGLCQMYAMRYAALPIARRTGGLADTIRNYNQDSGDGTGFLFDDLSQKSVYNTVGWAVWAWYNRQGHIESMRLRAMSQVFSWDDSAREYLTLFESVLRKRN